MKKVLLIGNGYWGSKIKKELDRVENLEVTTCTREYKELLKDKQINYVFIATPVETHYNICKQAIKHNKSVMCEKNFTSLYIEAEILYKSSLKRKTQLVIDYTYTFFTPELKSKFQKQSFKNIKSIEIELCQKGRFRQENVISIMGCHGFSLLDEILPFEYNIVFQSIKTKKSRDAIVEPTYADIRFNITSKLYNPIPVKLKTSLDSEEKKRDITFNYEDSKETICFAEPGGISRMINRFLEGYDNKRQALKVTHAVYEAIKLAN